MSLHIGDVPDRADVVIIGSGFGGSVMAAELAGHHGRVCVLERGRAYPPGSFPRTPSGISTNFWDPEHDLYGLFDVRAFRGIEAVVSSGVGGGSLIYANVMVRKPKAWFTQPHPYQPGVLETWSFTHADLAPHYRAVEEFLGLQELPLEPTYSLPKTDQFRRAEVGGVTATAAPLAVQFTNGANEAVIGAEVPGRGYPNLFNTARRTCRLCGECDLGCNEGSKNSLDHTYLSLASERCATIHQLTEVTSLRRCDDGFEVTVLVPAEDGKSARRQQTIRAAQVVLAAGTLGSTELLLRSRESLGLNNPALGTRFCGNGDLLGFIMDAKTNLDGWRGPVITSSMEFDGEHRMLIQDAGYPEFATWLVEAAVSARRLPAMARTLAAWLKTRFGRRRDTSLSAEISALLGRPTLTLRGMPVLGMGMDVPDGTLYLHRNPDGTKLLESTWSKQGSQPFFDVMVQRMETLAQEMGGRFSINPHAHLNRVITVHPVGGCPADTSHSIGVVDSYGRVRGVPGLRVCDGAVFPGPVGTNPSLTIAAFAHRAAAHMRNGNDDAWPEVGP